MADSARAARLAQRIKVIVAEAMRKTVKYPGMENITITEVRVTNDLQHATVYYTIFGSEEAQTEAEDSLQRSRGILRREVGKDLNIRLVPTLEFVNDEIPETADHVEELIREARQQDVQLAEQAQSAQYAGEADPYKKPAEEETPQRAMGDSLE